MKVLITGANGQVGWEINRQLKSAGFETIPLGRAGLDISQGEAVRRAFGSLQPDFVINCAAYTAVDKAESEPEQAFSINRDGPREIAKECATLGVPLIHFSTDYVFDGESSEPYQVDDPTNPINVYGESKLAGENAVRNHHDEHLILRTSWVFGRHGSNFVKTVLRLAQQDGALRVVNDQIGCPTSTASLAQFCTQLCQRFVNSQEMKWGTYHVADGPPTSWHEFASAVISIAGELNHVAGRQVIGIPSSEYPTPARRPRHSLLSVEKAVERLGFRPGAWRDELRSIIPLMTRRDETA